MIKQILRISALFTLFPVFAHADNMDRILIVSHVGKMAKEEKAIVKNLIQAMGPKAPTYGKELTQTIERSMSLDAGNNLPFNYKKQFEEGRGHFIEGDYKKAIITLKPLVTRFGKSDALIASNQHLRKPMLESMLFLAHAYLRNQNTNKSISTITEVLRFFPNSNPELSRFGPDLITLHRRVRLDLRKQQKAALSINSKKAGSSVFINGRYIGVTPTKAVDLLPGKYRVYFERPGKIGRVHEVVMSGSNNKLSIDHNLDTALNTSPNFVHLSYPDQNTQREYEHHHVLSIARAIGAEEITIFGFVKHLGRKVIQGQVLGVATGRVLRSGLLAMEPTIPNKSETQSLAAFLLSGKHSDDIIVGTASSVLPQQTVESTDSSFFSAKVWSWITLGVGVAATGTGIALIAMDGSGTCGESRCADSYSTMTPGIILTSLGGISLVSSAILFYVASNEETNEQAWITPWFNDKSAGLSAAWRF